MMVLVFTPRGWDLIRLGVARASEGWKSSSSDHLVQTSVGTIVLGWPWGPGSSVAWSSGTFWDEGDSNCESATTLTVGGTEGRGGCFHNQEA